MNIQFSESNDTISNKMIISWNGDTTILDKAQDGYVLAMELFSRGEVESACNNVRIFSEIYKRYNPGFENTLNALGYELMQDEEIKSALQIFKLNVELYPGSYNVYDSYGEALLNNGDRDEAIRNYRLSLEIFPESPSGNRVLQEIDKN